MKKTILVMVSLLSIQCGSAQNEEDSTTAPDYIDQELQGKINALDFTYKAGRLTEPSETDESKSWGFDLISNTVEDACDSFTLKSDDKIGVIFSVKEEKLKVGKLDLGLSFDSNKESQTITLLDSTGEVPQNNIATEGFLELTEITAGKVIGKIVAHMDEDNSINGNFEIMRCCRQDSGFDYEVCTEI